LIERIVVFIVAAPRPSEDAVVPTLVSNKDGSKPTQLSGCKPGEPSPCATANDWGPTWSPDGSRIAFLRALSASDRPVYIMNADGSGQHRLSPASIVAGVPTWQ